LFIRSFGAIVVHRGSWLGQKTGVEKRSFSCGASWTRAFAMGRVLSTS
jgi:hypothetical protein